MPALFRAVPGHPNAPRVSAATLELIERAASGLATRSVALMDERLSWFRALPAEQRSWVTLVAQDGIAGYVRWASAQIDDSRLTETVFGSAPRELIRAVSLRRTVELVRIAISVAEEHLPALAADAVERAALAESLLRYSREVAFAAAAVYATAAESRGAWDQRLEASVVDAIVRGEGGDALTSRAAALNWDSSLPVTVVAGRRAEHEQGTAGARVTERAAAVGANVMVGLQGDRMILVLCAPSPEALDECVESLLDVFGEGPVTRGPTGTGLDGAIASSGEALAALRVAAAWPGAPRGVRAAQLLPERVLAGDRAAADELRRQVFAPLIAAGEPFAGTLDAYFSSGRVLEPTARALFVHPNTVRYRLRRVTDLTGLDPWHPRDALTLQVGLALGRLPES